MRHDVHEARRLRAGLLALAGIGEHHRKLAALHLAHEIGPDLGFHDDPERGPRLTHELLNRIRRVIGEIALVNALGRHAHELLPGFASGGRHMRRNHVALGPGGKHGLKKRLRRIGFPDAYRMNPDAGPLGSQRIGPPGKAFVPVVAVGRLPARTPHEIETCKRKRHGSDGAVKPGGDFHNSLVLYF